MTGVNRLIVAALQAMVMGGMPAHGQTNHPSPRPTTLAELNCVVRTWGVDAGLWGTRPYAVAQTRDGYLWVGNREGLFRFNGTAFTRFDTAAIPQVGHRFIQKLCADHAGRLWMVTGDFRMACLREGEFIPIQGLDSSGEPIAWAPDPNGGIVASLHKEATDTILALTPETQIRLASSTRNHDRIASLGFSPDGKLWAATGNGQLMQVVDGRIEPVAISNERGTGMLLTRRDGTLATVGHRGVYEYRNGAWELRHPFEPLPNCREPIPQAAEDSRDNVWFGSAREGHWVWGEGMPLQRLDPGRGSAPSPVTSLVADADGNVWMTSFSGLYQARYSPFVTRVPPGEIPTSRVVSVCEDGRGTIWFSCFGGICRLAPGAVEPVLEVAQPPMEINNLTGDPQGGFWSGNGSEIFAGGRPLSTVHVTFSRMRRRVGLTGLFADDNGTVWVTHLNGMLRHRPADGTGEFEDLPPQEGLPEAFLVNLGRTRNGDLVVAARGHGIYRKRRGDEKWTLVTPKGDPVASLVSLMTVDAEDRLWLFSADDSRLSCWTQQDSFNAPLRDLGLDRGRIIRLVAGAEGGLWIATEFDGVAHAPLEELLAKMKDRARPVTVTWFDRSSGLGSKGGSFSTSAMIQSAEGVIWVATESGLSSIDPQEWLADRYRAKPPRLAIEGVTADGSRLPVVGLTKVPAGTVRLAIRYTELSFGLPGETRFRHRLLGLDDAWIEAGPDVEASFLKIPPGRYRFEATAANRHGQWNPLPAHVDLFIAPLWWQRTSVHAGAIGVVLMSILVFHRRRLAILREKEAMHAAFSRQLIDSQEAERQRLARELHDSLGPNLTIVKNRLTLEQERLAGATHPAPGLQAISDVVTQTIQEVRSISQNLRPYALDRAGLTRAIGELVTKISDATRLPVHCVLANIDALLAPANEMNLYRILQEGLNNIVKHADASQASLTIERSGNKILVRLTDDGRGFDRDSLASAVNSAPGMGLLSMEERARIMGATFQCKAARRAGTTLLIEIPIPRSE